MGRAKNIEKGDVIVAIDGQPAMENRYVQLQMVVRSANSLTIQKADKSIHTIAVKHRDMPEELYLQILFPIFYFLLAFGVALYVWRRNQNNLSTFLLILFLLTCSTAYISTGASARGNMIGMFVISSCIILCMVLFIHFYNTFSNTYKLSGPTLTANGCTY